MTRNRHLVTLIALVDRELAGIDGSSTALESVLGIGTCLLQAMTQQHLSVPAISLEACVLSRPKNQCSMEP